MLANVSFADDCDNLEDVDLIDIPKKILEDIDNIQKRFFVWMFDKSNNHKYWIEENGIKMYCSYGTSAFIEWLNTYVLESENAIIIKEFVDQIDEKLPVIYF